MSSVKQFQLNSEDLLSAVLQYQIKIIRSILKNTDLEAFNNYISSQENEKDKNSPTEEPVEEALEGVTIKASANEHHAYRRHVRYMRC